MKRRFRLRRSRDIQRVRRTGRSYAHPLIVLVKLTSGLSSMRVGVVVGRRVGNAVIRNRVKRRIRACMMGLIQTLEPGWDLLILARQPISEATYTEICSALKATIKRAGLIALEGSQGPCYG